MISLNQTSLSLCCDSFSSQKSHSTDTESEIEEIVGTKESRAAAAAAKKTPSSSLSQRMKDAGKKPSKK